MDIEKEFKVAIKNGEIDISIKGIESFEMLGILRYLEKNILEELQDTSSNIPTLQFAEENNEKTMD